MFWEIVNTAIYFYYLSFKWVTIYLLMPIYTVFAIARNFFKGPKPRLTYIGFVAQIAFLAHCPVQRALLKEKKCLPWLLKNVCCPPLLNRQSFVSFLVFTCTFVSYSIQICMGFGRTMCDHEVVVFGAQYGKFVFNSVATKTCARWYFVNSQLLLW